MDASKIFVVSYSPSQKAFHRETLADVLMHNRHALERGLRLDYAPIALFSTEEESIEAACEFVNHFRLSGGQSNDAA